MHLISLCLLLFFSFQSALESHFCDPLSGLWSESGQKFALSRLMHIYGQRYRVEVRSELTKSGIYDPKKTKLLPPTSGKPLNGQWAHNALSLLCHYERLSLKAIDFTVSADEIESDWRQRLDFFTAKEGYLDLSEQVVIPDEWIERISKFNRQKRVSLSLVIAALVGKHDANLGSNVIRWPNVLKPQFISMRLLLLLSVSEPILNMFAEVTSTVDSRLASGAKAVPLIKYLLIWLPQMGTDFQMLPKVEYSSAAELATKINHFMKRIGLLDQLASPVTAEDVLQELKTLKANVNEEKALLSSIKLIRNIQVAPSHLVLDPEGAYEYTASFVTAEKFLNVVATDILNDDDRAALTEKELAYLRYCYASLTSVEDALSQVNQEEALKKGGGGLAAVGNSTPKSSSCRGQKRKTGRMFLTWLSAHKKAAIFTTIVGTALVSGGYLWRPDLFGGNKTLCPNLASSALPPGLDSGSIFSLAIFIGVLLVLMLAVVAYYYRFIWTSSDTGDSSTTDDQSTAKDRQQLTKKENYTSKGISTVEGKVKKGDGRRQYKLASSVAVSGADAATTTSSKQTNKKKKGSPKETVSGKGAKVTLQKRTLSSAQQSPIAASSSSSSPVTKSSPTHSVFSLTSAVAPGKRGRQRRGAFAGSRAADQHQGPFRENFTPKVKVAAKNSTVVNTGGGGGSKSSFTSTTAALTSAFPKQRKK